MKKISIDQLPEFVANLMEKGILFAPVHDQGGVNFQKITDPSNVTLDFYNTRLSPKSVFFPQSEDMVHYTIEKGGAISQPVETEDGSAILLGVRPCDVRSFEIMDKLYEWDGVLDPYWCGRRKNTVIIGYAFDTEPDQADFYSTFGIHAADPGGSDIFMVRRDRDFIMQAVTPGGEELLRSLPSLVDASEEDRQAYEDIITKGQAAVTRSLSLEGVAEKLFSEFDNIAYWKEVAFACLSCGICTFVCPTCHCFDIRDENLFRQGVRKRIWDACTFTDFTLEASGHNPRAEKYRRLRQRFLHKFSYYVTNFGVSSCVGCGRCTRYCPVNIDIFSVIEGAVKTV